MDKVTGFSAAIDARALIKDMVRREIIGRVRRLLARFVQCLEKLFVENGF
jgi:carbon monoxide dehydrogenase subunit G